MTFIIAITLLLLAGVIGLPGFLREGLTWDALQLHFVSRLPLALPLVWLAVYAGRNYMLALRLQEEYAFKEALSTSFEGYKREMANIPATSEQLSPLLTLCDNVLRTLAQRPGRLYEGKHEDITPLAPVAKILNLGRSRNDRDEESPKG
ncbi:MAG: hypothetical protein ACRD2N_14625 [Vicinamibacterales bacterium]